LLRLRHRLSWRVIVNVELPAYFQRRAHRQQRARQDLKTRSYPRSAYRATLTQLRDLIAGLHLSSKTSVWANYEDHNTYSEAEHRSKQSFVGAFMAKHRPTTVWDLGCNQGEYAELAIRSGAGRVIGFDGDLQVLESAFRRAKSGPLDFLPLYCDAANPSPDQGWNQCERAGLRARRNADAVLALAFLHHLVIGCTIPLEAAVAWIVDCAPTGVVEFVDKTDPTVTRMLALREDVFPAYTKASFVQILSRRARIVGEAVLESGSRTLFAYQRP
jgi:ribosomal protein L11 methylase PrmA